MRHQQQQPQPSPPARSSVAAAAVTGGGGGYASSSGSEPSASPASSLDFHHSVAAALAQQQPSHIQQHQQQQLQQSQPQHYPHEPLPSWTPHGAPPGSTTGGLQPTWPVASPASSGLRNGGLEIPAAAAFTPSQQQQQPQQAPRKFISVPRNSSNSLNQQHHQQYGMPGGNMHQSLSLPSAVPGYYNAHAFSPQDFDDKKHKKLSFRKAEFGGVLGPVFARSERARRVRGWWNGRSAAFRMGMQVLSAVLVVAFLFALATVGRPPLQTTAPTTTNLVVAGQGGGHDGHGHDDHHHSGGHSHDEATHALLRQEHAGEEGVVVEEEGVGGSSVLVVEKHQHQHAGEAGAATPMTSKELSLGGSSAPYSSATSAASSSSSSPSSMLGRLRRFALQVGRRIGLLERNNERHLGQFELGGAGGRCPPPLPLPYAIPGAPGGGLAAEWLLSGSGGGNPVLVTPTHDHLHTHLLSRDLWAKHLWRQARRVSDERAAYDKSLSTPKPLGPPLLWVDNPWHVHSQAQLSTSSSTVASSVSARGEKPLVTADVALASMTLFSMYPDLHLHSDGSVSSDATIARAQEEQLAMYLLALASWVELLPSADRVHLFVNRPETCVALVGHDGSIQGRKEAMDRATKAAGPDGKGTANSNKLAAVHCRPFPCVHPQFGRGLVSCVWNDVWAHAEAELAQRRVQLRRERTTLLSALRASRPVEQGGQGLPRPVDPVTGQPLAWTSALDAELEGLLAQEDAASSSSLMADEDEVLVYVSPDSMLDMQMLTALTKLQRDAQAVQEQLRAQEAERLAKREGRSLVTSSKGPATAAAATTAPPSMGVDMDGTPLRDRGHWMAVSRQTDMVVPSNLMAVLRGEEMARRAATSTVTGAGASSATPQPASPSPSDASVSDLFHSPSAAFPDLLLDALEMVWETAYSVPSSSPPPAQVHSPYGISMLALRAGTVAALREHHALRAQQAHEAQEDAAELAELAGETDAAVHPSEELMRMRAAGMDPEQAGLASVEEASKLLSAAASLPASSHPDLDSFAPSFFPPFLAGLFRWENWMVSRLVIGGESAAGNAKQPFNVKVVDVSNSATLLHLQLPATTAATLRKLDAASFSKKNKDKDDKVLSPSAAEKALAQHDASGARFNEVLVRSLVGHDYRIGAVDSAPFLSVGSCVLERRRPPSSATRLDAPRGMVEEALSPSLLPPLCEVHPRPPGNFSHLYWFYKRASRASAPAAVVRAAAGSGEYMPPGYLIVLTVNSGYVQLALNWLCWARRIRFSSYLLLAEDQSSARIFRALGAPVIVSDSAEERLPPSDYGSVSFQRTMSFRTEFLMSLLLAGVHFATADMDAVWFDDPIAFFHPLADLTGQPHKGTKLSGGFVVVRSTPAGRLFWKSVIECQRMNAAFLAERKEGTYEPSLYTEQYCINELSRAMEEKNDPALLGQRSAEGDPRNFRKVLPSALLFPDGKAFFDEKRSQWANVAPAVIHNNWIMGAGGKWGRMVDWGMVSIADQGEARAAEVAKKVLRERRAPRAEDGEGVCAPVPVVPREPVPLRAVSTSPSSSSSTTPNTQAQEHHVHPFHMHVRLFLSPEASDGREHPQGPEAEFANLRRAVQALIDADYTSATVLSSAATNPAGNNAAAILKPSVHVEIMLDLFAHPVPSSSSSSASLSAEAKAEQAEWERLKAELKKLKAAWIAKFGEPASNGYTFVLEIKRPRASTSAGGRPSSRVGPLGLCSMPWPKVAGSSEDTEARTAESESPSSQQGSGGGVVVNPRHHDASLFLHDSVTLSPQWFTFTHALLQAYHAGVVPGGEHSLDDSFVDPRVYGISLLDAHQLQGETVHRRLNASEGQADRTAFAESALAATGIFNSTSATWRRVRHLAAHRARVAMASTASKSSSSSALQQQQQPQQPSEVALRAQLPNAFVSTRVFGFQQLSEFGALVWLPGHFDNWVAWLQEQHIPDTLNSTATLPSMDDASAPPGRHMAATKCVPGLASNALVQSLPPEQTWAQWINRWAYERGFYPLHARATEVQVSGASAEDIKKLQEALDKTNKDKEKDKDKSVVDLNKIVPLKAKDQKQRLAVALTAEQAAAAAVADKKDSSGSVSSVSLLSRPLGLFDLLLPPASTVSVFDFTLHVVRAPVTLAYRSLLAPAERVDQCYSLAQYEQRMDDIAANEARIKAEEASRKAAIKAVKDAEKKKKADAEKAAKAAAKAKLDAEKAKAKAEADAAAAAKKKKAAADKATADKKKKSTTDTAAATAAKKKKAEQGKAKKAGAAKKAGTAATPTTKKKAPKAAPAAAAEEVAETETSAAAAAAVADENDGPAPATEEAAAVTEE